MFPASIALLSNQSLLFFSLFLRPRIKTTHTARRFQFARAKRKKKENRNSICLTAVLFISPCVCVFSVLLLFSRVLPSASCSLSPLLKKELSVFLFPLRRYCRKRTQNKNKKTRTRLRKVTQIFPFSTHFPFSPCQCVFRRRDALVFFFLAIGHGESTIALHISSSVPSHTHTNRERLSEQRRHRYTHTRIIIKQKTDFKLDKKDKGKKKRREIQLRSDASNTVPSLRLHSFCLFLVLLPRLFFSPLLLSPLFFSSSSFRFRLCACLCVRDLCA